MTSIKRCTWCGTDPLYVKYHDEEWGKPLGTDNHKWFERLTLEGAQAGLSWITILRKRENYRAAFDGFDPLKVAQYDAAKIEELLQNSGLVRNRLKMTSTVNNARVFNQICAEFEHFYAYIEHFLPPVTNSDKPPKTHADIPTQTALSASISNDLKQRGMKFVGPTIIYALMQATGIVNDHIEDCDFR